MIGQSNMAGRGDFGEVEPIDNCNCLMLRMVRWQRMSEPVNPDRAVFVARFESGKHSTMVFLPCPPTTPCSDRREEQGRIAKQFVAEQSRRRRDA